MIEKLESLEKERQTIYAEMKKYQKSGFIIGGIGILFLIISVLGFENLSVLFVFGIILFIVAVIVVSIGESKAKPFKKSFKERVIRTLLESYYDELIYEPSIGIPIDKILSTQLVKKPDRYHLEDYISASYKKVKFQVSDIKLEERQVYRDSKGRTHVRYVTYFKGRWFIFKFERQFKDSLRVVEKGLLNYMTSLNGLEKVETESIEFNKKFSVQSTDKAHAFYIITPKMIENIMALEQGFRGHISFLWRNNELHIAVNDSVNTLEPKISQPLTDEGIKFYLPDIIIMKEIIEVFGLNRSKYMSSDL